jgi:hypothetical protein
MQTISASNPYFGHAANKVERANIKKYMPDFADRFDNMDVRVIDSKSETVLENLRALTKLAWTKLRGKAFEMVVLQTYIQTDNVHKESDDNHLGLNRIRRFTPEGRLLHITSLKAGK